MGKQKSPSLNSPSWWLKIIVKNIYTNDFTVIHVTFEKRKRMKTLNCILSAMAIVRCLLPLRYCKSNFEWIIRDISDRDLLCKINNEGLHGFIYYKY